MTGSTLRAQLTPRAPDLRHLAKWLGSDITGNAGLKNFSLAGALDSKGAVFNLAKASVALDGMVANGDMTLDLTKKTPNVSATLSTDVFSLDPYLAVQKGRHRERGQGRARAGTYHPSPSTGSRALTAT